MSELVLLDDHNADLGTEQTYLLEYGNTETDRDWETKYAAS